MININKENKYYIAFSHIPSVGYVKFNRLYSYFSSLDKAWQASFSELLQAGMDEKTTQEIIKIRQQLDLDQVLNNLNKLNIKTVSLANQNYPPLLKQIYNPPFLLYYQGQLTDHRDEFSLSIVGTRRLTNYGHQATLKLSSELSQNNLCIVSGLALGIDALAHTACLENHGRTIAVLGSGLAPQVFYPRANFKLGQKIIAQGGLLLSEYPPQTQPQKFFFPQRNRIVSGLSLGTLVIEAPLKSGALLTARLALEQNREIFALPGSIYSKNSEGSNNLIKMGAHLINNSQDILNTLNLQQITNFIESKKNVADTADEAIILKHLSHEPIHIDELVRNTKLDTGQINSTLTLMEMKGKIRNLGGMLYVLGH